MKRILERLTKMLLNNWGLKLSSLLIAVVVWFVVALVGDPQDTRPFNNIPVRLINTQLLEEKNKVYEVIEGGDVVKVYVTAPTSVFQTLRAEDIIAEADVSKLTDINSIAINFYTTNTAAEGVSFEGDHDMVYLNVEDRDSKWIRVTYQTVGEVAEGYVIGATSADQTVINISGPASVVSQVGSAYAELNVDGATNNVSANVDILLKDKDGNIQEFPNIEKNTNHLLLSATVLATKEVPIVAQISGEPGEGYVKIGDPVLNADRVTVAGTPAALLNIQKIQIPKEKLDISGAQGDVVFQINLKEYLPADVRLEDSDFNGRLSVTVTIKAAREKNFEVPVSNISLDNVPDGILAEIVMEEESPGYVSLRVYGLRETVNGLRVANIHGRADFGLWMQQVGLTSVEAGEYEIPVTFLLEDGLSQISSGTVRVRVGSAE